MSAQHSHQGHRNRLKKRFIDNGLTSFETHNILELLLFFSVPRMDTNDLAHTLINEFGSLANVFDASYHDLVKVKGVGENTAALIKLIPSLCSAYLESKNDFTENEIIDSTKKAGQYMLTKFVGSREELVYLLCLDNRRKVISCNLVHRGSVNSAHISKRLIAEIALRNNSVSCIIAHNHPGGHAIPSSDDLATTKTIKSTLEAVGIKLQDHIITADTEFVSFAESNLI